MSTHLRGIVIRALALPFALAIVVGVLSSTEIVYLQRLAKTVDHTRLVIFTASRMLRLIVDQETGIRGYLLTGASEFLEPYVKGAPEIERDMVDLRQQIRGSPMQLERLSALRREVEIWQMEARAWIATGSPAAIARSQASQLEALQLAKARMDDIRDRVDAIVDDEQQSLTARQEMLARTSRDLIVGGGALVLALAAGMAFVLRRQIVAIERIYQVALTDREASEERERRARGQAEAANRTKDEFLATVSHELRTPLTAMLGWARLLRGKRVDQSRTERAVEAIERNAVAQAQLIEDLLDVSRIVSGKLRLDLHEADLHQIVEAAVESLRPSMDAKRIRFEMLLDPVGAHVLGDPNRLQQIVWNLLSNAIKFTDKEGRVTLSVARINSHVELAVRDDGRGIDPQFLSRVFQRFEQEESGESRLHGGLGLGLAISRHLVELHGGTIEAASGGPGQGAVFTVKLPLLPLTRKADEKEVHPSLSRDVRLEATPEVQGLKVLIVDDEPDTRELLVATLTSFGCQVRAAAGAEEALRAVAAWSPEVIVSDIGLRGESGYDLVRKIRTLPAEEGGRIPAAALTAYARPEDRRRALRAGFEMFLPKPVEPGELVAALATLARIGEAMKETR
jgi:signal transduction histidine kinase/ActR/RegA family two-component response regulator